MQIDFKKVWLILRKELLEIRQQRALVLGLIFLPLLLTVIPLLIIFALGLIPPDQVHGVNSLLDAVGASPALRGLPPQQIIQAMVGQPISTILFLLPVILPSIIASYSIVGEKVARTLEPVLATPVTTPEL